MTTTTAEPSPEQASLIETDTLKFALPKGRMQEGVLRLLADAGIKVSTSSRNYKPSINLPGVDCKILKPHNIVEMLHAGSRHIGFAGADWVAEFGLDLVELLDTGLDPVRLVAAAPRALVDSSDTVRPPTGRPLVVASEYENLAKRWIGANYPGARFLRTYGATEVFPPEDADCIVDNTATGATLAANDLAIVDELMTSSTRLYAAPAALQVPALRRRIDHIVTLVRSVLDARARVIIELNADDAALEAIIEAIPAMRRPTVAPLHGGSGFAIKAAVPRSELTGLLPRLKSLGATDILITPPAQIIP
jgi:ATP phosphoribosyltransferase